MSKKSKRFYKTIIIDIASTSHINIDQKDKIRSVIHFKL